MVLFLSQNMGAPFFKKDGTVSTREICQPVSPAEQYMQDVSYDRKIMY